MKTTPSSFCAIVLAAMAFGLVAITPAAAQSCLGKRDVQEAIATGQILSLAEILGRAGIDSSQEVLSVQVCDQGGQLVYIVAVLDDSGGAENLVLNARTGGR